MSVETAMWMKAKSVLCSGARIWGGYDEKYHR